MGGSERLSRPSDPGPADEDQRRFTELFLATNARLRASARRHLDAASAEDVVAEAYVVAWRRFAEVPTDPDAARRWLHRVMHYGVRNAARGDRRRTALQERLRRVEGRTDGDGRAVEFDEAPEALVAAFAALSEGDRTILLLAAWDGVGSNDLARLLRCSPSAAATRLSRARARLDAAG